MKLVPGQSSPKKILMPLWGFHKNRASASPGAAASASRRRGLPRNWVLACFDVGRRDMNSHLLAQQQQCQLECTVVTQSGEARVTRSCYALDAEQCALVAKADTGGQQTCRGYLTTNCVNDR
jgi:hypothetical protein